jgi:cyclopropane fatty-acyl-phospholipid synthase-like methyltransferase
VAVTQDIYRTGEYTRKNPSLHTEDSLWKASQILKMLGRHSLLPKRVCDVGCGAGLILRILQKQLPPDTILHGYEISEAAVEMCRVHEDDRLCFFCCDLTTTETDAYDLLLAMDVFEHVEDYMGWLRRLRTKSELKLFHVPLEITVAAALSPENAFIRNRNQAGHLHYFTRATALATLRDTGYEIIDSLYTPSYEIVADQLGRRDAIFRKLLHFAGEDLKSRILGGYSLLVLAR